MGEGRRKGLRLDKKKWVSVFKEGKENGHEPPRQRGAITMPRRLNHVWENSVRSRNTCRTSRDEGPVELFLNGAAIRGIQSSIPSLSVCRQKNEAKNVKCSPIPPHFTAKFSLQTHIDGRHEHPGNFEQISSIEEFPPLKKKSSVCSFHRKKSTSGQISTA